MINQIFDDVKHKYMNRPDRFEHILGVIKTAVALSIQYGVDTNKAYIAALFHDYTKYDTIEYQKKYLSKEEFLQYYDYPVMYHALSAANLLKEKYNITDVDILNSIRYHVHGRISMTKLEKIILLADKTEPTRKYTTVDKIRDLSYKSLDDAIIYLLEDTIKYNQSKNYQTNPEVLKIIKELKGD
ncbi:bis(5'-nucleosyl)-tetraphosphatase (symmetrical) YqeK [Acholeplasma granularum]|uniref:bis(5'-nucleosyl)-tetraphosphatase (symmetrical) YqeK n=1 Tax=Acholeplasma granularum TaxID=264635 RepID=UPI00047206D6|nr:bis(5'-nucleosyl)-tetraphosphatase (symmetrical) YqeK [Acholeplasma granularum]